MRSVSPLLARCLPLPCYGGITVAHLRLAITLALVFVPAVQGYANWLKCYVELDDPDEIIMHKPIISSIAQSDSERAYIEVQPYASGRKDPWISAFEQDIEDLFPHTIYQNQPSMLLKIRLRVPPTLKKKDVQFIIDSSGDGLVFVGPGVMCDGKRASSRQHDQHVLLQISKNATVDVDSAKALINDIKLFAGWAAGYEAVKLTPTMILKRNRDYGRSDVDTTREPQHLREEL